MVIPVLDEQPRRSDARRNRQAVLAAAEAELAANGLKTTIEAIAKRAGVGVGTVCRHFPTKQALIEAVLVSMYAELLADAEAALEHADAGAAFLQFFDSVSAFQGRHRALAEQMATDLALPASEEPLKLALHAAISEIVTRAQAAGAVRDDIGPADVAMLFSGVAHATATVDSLAPTLRERYLHIILDGLRPAAAAPLPGRPLEFAELRRLRRRQDRARA
jgi:AcrR family transcriptional regulator